MSARTVFLLTVSAMLAFAGNSLLCRIALRGAHIDPASFTLVRLAAGALMLAPISYARKGGGIRGGSWTSAIMLFTYAAAFSLAYASLSAGTGALLLFGAVQLTMIGYGLWRGERLNTWQSLGLASALAGLVLLMLPGLSTPAPGGALLMAAAGVAWGVYSLRGRGAGDPIGGTAGNFLRSIPFAVALELALSAHPAMDAYGIACGVASGALASGLGYVMWYMVLPRLGATTAASIQLSVPVITAIGATLFLGEQVSLRLVGASLAVLGGIGLVIAKRRAR